MNAGVLLRVTGLVQGVGFRPFVYRLAVRHRLDGWVRNTSTDVEIAVEGEAPEVEAFIGDLYRAPPPAARVEAVECQVLTAEDRQGFTIRPSVPGNGGQPVPPDLAICAACEAELLDPANRRHRYPFVTCTDCGPRFSVIEGMPYDRMRSTMRAFAMCPECRAEYADPEDRRHHSQTNSCPRCGPRLWLERADGAIIASGTDAAIEEAATWIECGGIVALRGLGGFQLVADATSEAAVWLLRRRKHREAKPFAVMVGSLAEARTLVRLSVPVARTLESPERPIVVAPARHPNPLAASVAPGIGAVGVMLPTSGLHRLLCDRLRRPLIMTSGNLSDEPIVIDNVEAAARLAAVADVFLLHDREIASRYDDSVVRCAEGARPVVIRRARGYAPLPLSLPVPTPRPLVAVGPHLKNTLTLAGGARAWVSQHVGDLDDVAALDSFNAALARFEELFDLWPTAAARDLHPAYLSTRIAAGLGCDRVIAVQHHHAHVAAVAAEHGLTAPILGLACDGTGCGDDGTVWGSELLMADLTGYRRLGHLLPAPLPGGDAAARRPWRSAMGYLGSFPGAGRALGALAAVPPAELAATSELLATGVNTPLASSLGRLFDAAAALLGVRLVASYEGQAAMELEALAARRVARAVEPRIVESDGRLQIDPRPMLAELGERASAGEPVEDLAAVFHASVAAALVDITARAANGYGLRTVALSGGSFQNIHLAGLVRAGLQQRGLRVIAPLLLPPNDGAISYGQAAIAAAILAAEGAT